MRERFQAGLARQLGRPEGLRGRMIGRLLNRGNRSAVRAAVEAAGLEKGQTAADVGFGGGLGLRLLRDRVGDEGHVHGVELSDTMLAAAGRRHDREIAAGRMTLHAGLLEELPLADADVDGLITVNTLYFVDDLARTFRELARVVRPGGRAVVGVGDPDSMATMPFTAHGFRLRPLDELEAGLRDAGFDVRRTELDRDGLRFHLLVGERA